MNKNQKKYTVLTTGIILLLLTSNILIGSALAAPINLEGKGFQKGVAWKPYLSLKRATFVQFDENSYLDDYAYLAAVPTSVFYDTASEQVFASPLLYFEPPYPIQHEKERTLNTRQGIDYFMEDWLAACNQKLDHLTLINVPSSAMDNTWKASTTTTISNTNPYDLAADLALHDWTYSDQAVVAVIEENFEKPENTTTGTLQGTIENKEIKTQHFEVPKTNEVYPEYNEFDVPEGYKFLKIRSWYPSFYMDIGVPGFEGIVNMSIPAGDRDLQIYCEKDGAWMMAGITSEWNAQGGMDIDKTSVYVYQSGKWSVALTDVPTKSLGLRTNFPVGDNTIIDMALEPQKHRNLLSFGFGRYGTILDVLRNMRQVTYKIDIEMYPGTILDIPETPPFGCRNAQFTLTWDDPAAALGLSLIGPAGEEILSTREPGVSTKCAPADGHSEGDIPFPTGTETDLVVERLGECVPGEQYSLCVFAMNELSSSTDFTITYEWEQNYTRQEADSLASATEGAVLASLLNAPLLYMNTSAVSTITQNALYQMGCDTIYLLDFGEHATQQAVNQLSSIAQINMRITDPNEFYTMIYEDTQRNDIIFSTMDPFTPWYIAEVVEIAEEMPGALALGPSAYLAAVHGSPVIIIDLHPELSSAVVWHNELWRRHPDGFSKLPTVSEMYLTGKRVYSFLKELGLDQEGEETIITLAGQFDIGLPWDRVFVGKANPGRFIGSPTDLSVWVAKTMFYPQLVFENPAIKQSTGVELINGSSSIRRFPYRGKLGLKITKPSQEETFHYPVLDTLICYDHKFNSRASTFWGFTYTCADGDIPGVTQSFEPIDEGVMLAVNGKSGGYFADLSGSEVQPFYLQKAGYDPVFSTNFEANMYNLNQGVLLWLINTHGAPLNGGMLMFWDVEGNNPQGYPPMLPALTGYSKEINPWRGYEWLLGSTEEPDTMTMDIHGILPSLAGNPDPRGIRFLSTALDWALARRPFRDLLGKIASLPGLRLITPDWLQNTQDYYDGVIITVLLGRFGTSWYNGTQIDDALGNIHSTGISSVACLPAGKYLHLSMMRHGSVFQIMDPWATSWYSDVWQNGVPRGIALGKTIGEIYAEGISKVGISYITEPPNWWWDLAENVCLYGDPDLRIWVPSTEYSTQNHWTLAEAAVLHVSSHDDFMVSGHAPFGAHDYPYARAATNLYEQILWVFVIVLILGLIIIGAVVFAAKRRT